MKIDYAVGTDPEGLGEILDSGSLKIDHYLNVTLRQVQDAVGPQECRIPQYWTFILGKLKLWHKEHQEWREGRKQSAPKRNRTKESEIDNRGDSKGLHSAKTEAATTDATSVETLSWVATLRASDSLCPGSSMYQQELPAPATEQTQDLPTLSANTFNVSPSAIRFAKRDLFPPWPANCDLAVEESPQHLQLQPPTSMESHAHNYTQAHTQTQAQTLPPQPTPAFDLPNTGLGEYGTALQHGDLYLWTEEMGGLPFSNWMDVDDVGGGMGNGAIFGSGDGIGSGTTTGNFGGWAGFGGAGSL